MKTEVQETSFKSIFADEKTISSGKYRNWFITIVYKDDKNVTDNFIKSQIDKLSDVMYYTYQLERGIKAGKLHHHLFIRYKNPKKHNQIGRIFYTAHIQHITGPIQRVIKYCTKEITRVRKPVEWGVLPLQGKRNDLVEIMDMVKCEWSNDQIADIYPSQVFFYYKHINQMRDKYYEKKLADDYRNIKVTYIYGKTRTGKTRSIYQNHNALDIYRITNYKNPFDMYDGQDVMVFDEFRCQIDLSDMLEYLDGYLTRLRARYHDKIARYTQVYIISNEKFETMYPKVKEERIDTYEAFCERIFEIKEYIKDKEGNTVVINHGSPKEYFKKLKKARLRNFVNDTKKFKASHIKLLKTKDWFDDNDYFEYYDINQLVIEISNKI